MEEYICEKCGKKCSGEEGLRMHTSAKHSESVPKEKTSMSKKTKSRLIFWSATIIIIALLVWGAIALVGNTEERPQFVITDLSSVPPTALHWHPKITIYIEEQRQDIPTDIGIRVGRVVDRSLSGHGGGSPTHTHSSDGIIHVENLRPREAPETLTLGYFFWIWEKQFNSTCIFDKCGGELTMTVNGEENFELENYLMQDEDSIIIEYTS